MTDYRHDLMEQERKSDRRNGLLVAGLLALVFVVFAFVFV